MEDTSKRDRDRIDIEHPSHAPETVSHAPGNPSHASENEGEGSRSGARDYDERTRKFVESGQVDKKAKEAEKAIDSDEGDSLRKAEDEGKGHAKGEDPKLRR
jgi:hypothetical protein